ncbi:TolC family protein [Paraflavitalea sp. CAU 1676]|uniref:TolC family protein n=1 Tax=Paraflavitalea sp. CAU 1676 TaxID=3032598 RepID=UPI0023D9E504|nr:TolC family protein [Paraflavitalea sp. CAU 1676]MDF2190819.1 TolC family protein [Paraflavitalea sp. CAU 1676]
MKKIVSGALLLLLMEAGFAQESPIRDEQLKGLIQSAVTNYPRIKELEEQLKADDVKGEIIRAGYLPTVSADVNYNFIAPSPKVEFETPGGKSSLAFQPYNNYNAAVSVRQLIYDFGKTKLKLDRNEAQRDLNVNGIDNTKNAIAYQTAQIYYNIQFVQKGILVQQDQINSLKENEKLIQTKIKNGDALEYDLLTTQVRTANATNRLSDLQTQLEKLYVLMQWLSGVDTRGKIAASGTDTYREDVLNLVLEPGDWKKTNYDAQQIEKQIAVYEYDKKEASIESRPNIMGSASGGVRNGIQPDIDQFRLNGNFGVGISIPILSSDRPKLRQKMTQVQIETARKSMQTLESTIQKDLATVQQDYKGIQEKLGNTNVLVVQAQRAYKLAQVRFKEGLITNVELLDAQTNVENAQLQQVQLQYQAQLDKLESHKVVGSKIF